MPKNDELNMAKVQKKDEFYTQLSDIEKELAYYRPHFEGKTVFCNCDDPRDSAFFVYFRDRFRELRLKRLIVSCCKPREVGLFAAPPEDAVWIDYDGFLIGGKPPTAEEIGLRVFRGTGTSEARKA